MEYVVYRRFKAEGIDGAFNLRYGTTVTERDGFLYAADGRKICAATSENGWEHFRPNTPEGAYRQKMLDGLSIPRPYSIAIEMNPPRSDLGLEREVDRFPFVPDDPSQLEQDC